MDPSDAFAAAALFKWDPRTAAAAAAAAAAAQQSRLMEGTVVGGAPVQTPLSVGFYGCSGGRAREQLQEMFQAYGVRYVTVDKIGELGFTASTLVGMRDEELDDMMATLSHVFRWDLLVGERYGIKAAVRAERRRLNLFDPAAGFARRSGVVLSPTDTTVLDALSQEGLSEEPMQEAAGSGGEGGNMNANPSKQQRKAVGKRQQKKAKKKKMDAEDDDEEDEEEDDEEDIVVGRGGGGGGERQREHPFIVTEPGEVARGKKNGLDYLFHLYDQCREFLLQVQALAKERGDKCPTKVTNQVFRYAKRAGANYINKPKMRHYVHCYALHCLDEEVSNALRRAFKERGENVGAWRQACYRPLVLISARHGWDVDAVFNAHPRLAIWYVPTKLRQLCHLARSNAAASSASCNSATDIPAVAGHVFRQQ